METLLGALFIFCLKITDVSLGTIRMIVIIQGRKNLAAAIGFVEVTIFIVAVGKVVGNMGNVWNVIAYSAGFAAGTLVGITLEEWIALGYQMIRVITQKENDELIKILRGSGFALTQVGAEGMDGPVYVLFSVVRRRRVKEFLQIIRHWAPAAFVTVEDTKRRFHGYFQQVKKK